MKSVRVIGALVAFLCSCLTVELTQAAFHAMQIEQVIGGVNSDPNAQAIQLRLRSNGHNLVSPARIRAWDAAGANPIVVVDMEDHSHITNGSAGSRILITSPAFANYTDVALVSDYTFANKIPASYLAAGRLTFETDNGATIYWSLAWGGTGYTGSTTGSTFNDADGNFGPPYAGALPSTSTSALLTNLAATGAGAFSTNNAANYGETPGAATFRNNAGTAFVVTIPDPPPPDSGDFDDDEDVDGFDFLTWQLNAGGPGDFEDGDANHDGQVNGDDLIIWEAQYALPPPLSGLAAVPEPCTLGLALCGLVAWRRRRRP